MSNLSQVFGGNFDANNVDPSTSYDPIPNGEYMALITDSDVKPTKAGTGYYMQLVWEVIDGQYKGRKVFDRINIQNANKTAEEIGQRELSAICHAVGKMNPADSTELHNIPALIKVKIKPAQDGYDASNEVNGYEAANQPAQQPAPQQQPMQGVNPAPQAMPAAGNPSPQQPAPGTTPW